MELNFKALYFPSISHLTKGFHLNMTICSNDRYGGDIAKLKDTIWILEIFFERKKSENESYEGRIFSFEVTWDNAINDFTQWFWPLNLFGYEMLWYSTMTTTIHRVIFNRLVSARHFHKQIKTKIWAHLKLRWIMNEILFKIARCIRGCTFG